MANLGTSSTISSGETYSGVARFFHWVTVLLLLVQVPVGLYMVYRAYDLKLFDGITNNLYTTHKTIGFVLLALVALRLLYRLFAGAPPHEPTLRPWHRVLSRLDHWGIYALLILVPLLGWLGVTFYPARDLFAGISLPQAPNFLADALQWFLTTFTTTALEQTVAPHEKSANVIFAVHAWAAFALLALIALHIVAVIYHRAIRKDGVLRRMLPGSDKP